MIEIYDGTQWDAFIELSHKMHSESSFKDIHFSDSKVATLIEDPDVFLALYKRDGKYIGFMLAGISTYFFGDETSSYDMALFVDPAHRGGFAVVRLVQAYEDWARSKNVSEIYLSQFTGVDIEKTAKLYSKLGYTQLGCTTKKRI